MIVWSGRGITIILALILGLVFGFSIFSDKNLDYAFVISAFTGGIFSGYFGNRWNQTKARTVIDAETGQKLMLKNRHSLFWIPMQYWGWILPILGTVILFQKSLILAISSTIFLIGFFVVSTLRKTTKEKPATKFTTKQKTANPSKDEEEKQLAEQEQIERENRKKEKEDPKRFMPK